MKSKFLPITISICVTVCVLAMIVFAVFTSWEADLALSLPLKLIPTEISCDGGATWTPYGNGEALHWQRGDVAVRGHFNYDVMEGWCVNLYFQHMQMELLVNGERIADFARVFKEIRPEWCTDIWIPFMLPSISMEDVVELRLYSLHPDGARMGAYQKTLDSITTGDPFFVYQKITLQNSLDQNIGLTLMIVGIVLFCIAFVALLMKSPLQRGMMYTALFAFGEGLFWLADAAEIAHYVSNSIVFFSVGRYVSRMLCIYALLASTTEYAEGKAKTIAQTAAYTNGVLVIAYLALNIAGVITFCESEQIWCGIQSLHLLIGLGCSLWALMHNRKSVWRVPGMLALVLAYGALLFDMGTLMLGRYTEMDISKWVCGTVVTAQAAALLVKLPASYEAIRRAEKLSMELHNSRIVLAMSQIRTHFVFNVLNAISGLCKSDPALADMELVHFSRYLRNNIDIMQEDHPITFEKALEHMHNYVELEQLRFGDKISLDENYEDVNFLIPSLVIQPLVENAIKHGLLPKEEGGIIRVSTYRCGESVMIEIADNGVGFDTTKEICKESVGLSNVRFRVEKMMNGRMQVESTPGKGTTVRLWLPRGKEESSSESFA